MKNAKIFYKDDTNIIYLLFDPQVGRYFLNVPVNQYQNFMTFLNYKKFLDSQKGANSNGQ